MYIAPERLYLQAGVVYRESQLTPEMSAILLVAEGGALTDDEAARYGLTGDAKAKKAGADKARSVGADKGGAS